MTGPAFGAGRDAVGALHVVAQDVAVEGQQGFRGSVEVVVIDRLGHVIDDVDLDGAGGDVAQAVGGLVGEAFVQGIGAVVRVRRGAGRRGQGVGVAAVGVQQQLAVGADGIADQAVGDRAAAAVTAPTRVPLAVSPVLPGWLPITLPGARSWPSWFRSRAFS